MKNLVSVKLGVAVILVIVGCGLLIAGFVVTPPGEIHNSVLIAFGEILTFVGTVFGMQYKFRDELYRHFNNGASDNVDISDKRTSESREVGE